MERKEQRTLPIHDTVEPETANAGFQIAFYFYNKPVVRDF